MGNEASKSNATLGVCAMSFTTNNIEQEQFLTIRDKLKGSVDGGVCSRKDFDSAIAAVEKFEESDTELFDKLFIMFDNSGDGNIQIKEYLAGLGGTLITGTSLEKLTFAFKIYNIENEDAPIDRSTMKKVLNSINLVASYFGDPVLSPQDIDKVVLDTFQKSASPTTPMSIEECVPVIVGHNTSEGFMEGKGTVKFGR